MMFSKINVINIIGDHISTLKIYGTDNISRSDLMVFFGLPAIISGISLFLCGVMAGTMVNLLTTSLSIFAALLFNLLLLLYDAIRKEEYKEMNNKIRKAFLKELFNNISFCILVAITSIVLLLIYSQIKNDITQYIITYVCYYLVIVFILTVFMILKRTHVLLSKEIDNTSMNGLSYNDERLSINNKRVN